jgi:RNA polymerase subunit RPABC4/transcription elongation factor Spt4
MLLCNHCNTKIDKRWNFCPKCGSKLRNGFDLNEIINRQIEQFKKILDVTGYDISIQPQSDNTFVVNISHGFEDSPQEFRESKPESYKPNFERSQMKMPTNVLDPKVVIKRNQGKIMLEVDLPGISKESNIEITRMNNSTEIRAKNKDLGYFKILGIPGKYRLVTKTFEDETLLLEFAF